MMARSALALAVAIGLTALEPALATPASRLMDYVQRPEARRAVEEAVRRQLAALSEGCGSLSLRPGELTVLRPPSFGTDDRPREGAWREAWIGEGCGASWTFNVWTVAEGDGPPEVFTTVPGTSIADPALQRDGVSRALAGAAIAVPEGCPEIAVTDTAFLAYESVSARATPPDHGARPWQEAWTVTACGRTAVVTLHFIPDTTGTTIRTTPRETRTIDGARAWAR